MVLLRYVRAIIIIYPQKTNTSNHKFFPLHSIRPRRETENWWKLNIASEKMHGISELFARIYEFLPFIERNFDRK